MNYLNREYMSQQRGGAIVKILLFIPLLVLLVIGFYEGRKAYWDYQVKDMCEKDGGVVIIDLMNISQEQEKYLPHAGGVVSISPESLAHPSAPAFIKTNKQIIKDGSPTVVRLEYEVIRRSDGQQIATAVSYLRTGGDIPSPAFPSSYYCPVTGKITTDLSKIFAIKESRK